MHKRVGYLDGVNELKKLNWLAGLIVHYIFQIGHAVMFFDSLIYCCLDSFFNGQHICFEWC